MIPDNLQRRSVVIDESMIDAAARTVKLSFSSETPVERCDGLEILDHSPGSCDLTRLLASAPLLLNHDTEDQVGVVETAYIDTDARKGYATVRFSKSAEADEIFVDVVDRIRSLVSFGYVINSVITTTDADGLVSNRATSWMPYEISICSIPADFSIGVGRTLENPIDLTSKIMKPETVVADDATETDETRALSLESARIAALKQIGERASAVSIKLDVESAIADGSSPSVMQERLTSALIARNTPYAAPAVSGPSKQESRDLSTFSLTRGIQKLMSNQPLDGIELEMHQEAQREAKESGLSLRGGLSIPTLLINHGRRDMSVTGGSNGNAGGTTVQTSQGSFIDLLYAKMVLSDLGAQYLTGLVGNIDLPKLLTGSAPTKKTENAAADESSPTTGKISLSPKRLPTYIEVSKQLLAQSSVSVEGILRNDLATALALAMELGAINGGGSDEPTGILNTSSIGSVAGGTDGLSPTWAHVIALETAVSTSNADIGNLAYLTNPKVRGKLKSTTKAASGDSVMVWGEGTTPLNGYRAGVTTQVPSTLTKGASNGVCSGIIFGNFADLVIAQWGGIDIQVNPYIKDTEGLVRITADVYYDAAVRRAASFAAMKDALTA